MQGNEEWPISVFVDEPSVETVTEALRTGPYGKCVYDTDNDVCDNQVRSVMIIFGKEK